jgi:hypothetical protein
MRDRTPTIGLEGGGPGGWFLFVFGPLFVTPLSLKLESYLRERSLGRRVGVAKNRNLRMNDSHNNSAHFIVAVFSRAGHCSSVLIERKVTL